MYEWMDNFIYVRTFLFVSLSIYINPSISVYMYVCVIVFFFIHVHLSIFICHLYYCLFFCSSMYIYIFWLYFYCTHRSVQFITPDSYDNKDQGRRCCIIVISLLDIRTLASWLALQIEAVFCIEIRSPSLPHLLYKPDNRQRKHHHTKSSLTNSSLQLFVFCLHQADVHIILRKE